MDEVELNEPMEAAGDLVANAIAAAEQAGTGDDGVADLGGTDPSAAESEGQSPFEAAAEAGAKPTDAKDGKGEEESGEAAAPDGPAPSPFSELRLLARKKQEELATPDKPEPTPAEPGVAKLLETFAEERRERAAIEELARTGSLAGIAKIAGVDPGRLFELAAKQGMQPGSVSAEQELADLRAKVAQLEEGTKKTLEEHRQEEEQRRDDERARRDGQELLRLTTPPEGEGAAPGAYPLMGRLAHDMRMKYANEAWALLHEQHGRVPTPKETAELAEKQLAHLAHQLRGAGEQTSTGPNSAVASDQARRGSTQRRGTIDNRTASEVSAIPPDHLDDETRVLRAIKAAEAASRQA